jgi:hypothetical protein
MLATGSSESKIGKGGKQSMSGGERGGCSSDLRSLYPFPPKALSGSFALRMVTLISRSSGGLNSVTRLYGLRTNGVSHNVGIES